MNNITCNGNKVRRIYSNGVLVQDIKYANKQVLGYRRTDQLEDVAFDVTGSNWANTNLNSSFKVLMAGTSKIQTKYICRDMRYTFTELPSSGGATLTATFGVFGVFRITIEYYKNPIGGGVVTINGVGYKGYPNSVTCSFADKKVYVLAYGDDGKEIALQFDFPPDSIKSDIEKRYGYVELTSGGSETTERRGVTGHFEVLDQYPIK